MKSEFECIAELSRILGKPSRRVLTGIGDDAAVVEPPRRALLATVDRLVEGVHFDLSYSSAESVGHKALAVSLSDMAAMGGKPLYALISLGLPKKTTDLFLSHLYRGIRHLAKKHRVDIIGGNISKCRGGLIVDTTVLGEPYEAILLRRGAKPGDKLMVTGHLGAAAAGLHALQKWGKKAGARFPKCTTAHLFPSPRLEQGKRLASFSPVGACIDISDGFSSELHHLAKASDVGFRILRDRLPISPETLKAAHSLGRDAAAWALTGGEDYELLFTVAARDVPKLEKHFKEKHWPLAEVGMVVAKQQGIQIQNSRGQWEALSNRGWIHF